MVNGEINFAGSLNPDELAFIFRQASPVKKWFIIGWAAVVILLTTAILAGGIRSGFNQDWFGANSYLLPIYFGVLYFGLFFYLSPSLSARRAFKQNPHFAEPLAGTAGPEWIAFEAPGPRSELRWNLFKSASLFPGLVLLYQTNSTFNYFPRKFFQSEADWQAFRTLVHQKVPHRIEFEGENRAVFPVRHARLLFYGVLAAGVLLAVAYGISNFR